MTKPVLQETRVFQSRDGHSMVEVVLADSPKEEEATFYLRGRCILDPPLEVAKKPLLLQVQRQALHQLQYAIDDEMVRISNP